VGVGVDLGVEGFAAAAAKAKKGAPVLLLVKRAEGSFFISFEA
jgi:hypothetical protein